MNVESAERCIAEVLAKGQVIATRYSVAGAFRWALPATAQKKLPPQDSATVGYDRYDSSNAEFAAGHWPAARLRRRARHAVCERNCEVRPAPAGQRQSQEGGGLSRCPVEGRSGRGRHVHRRYAGRQVSGAQHHREVSRERKTASSSSPATTTRIIRCATRRSSAPTTAARPAHCCSNSPTSCAASLATAIASGWCGTTPRRAMKPDTEIAFHDRQPLRHHAIWRKSGKPMAR